MSGPKPLRSGAGFHGLHRAARRHRGHGPDGLPAADQHRGVARQLQRRLHPRGLSEGARPLPPVAGHPPRVPPFYLNAKVFVRISVGLFIRVRRSSSRCPLSICTGLIHLKDHAPAPPCAATSLPLPPSNGCAHALGGCEFSEGKPGARRRAATAPACSARALLAVGSKVIKC
jgi:hypothetical protein